MKNCKARDTASTASLRPRAVNYELSKAIDIVISTQFIWKNNYKGEFSITSIKCKQVWKIIHKVAQAFNSDHEVKIQIK